MKLHRTMITLLILILNILCFAQFAGGSGTVEDPYLIETAEQLNQVRNYMTSSFKQIADIDLGVPPWNENGGWPAIGYYDPWNNSTSFSGNFDGNNFMIENLMRDTLSTSWAGLFGSTRGCLLKNINLINFHIEAVGSTLGGLTGISHNDTWSNINAEGTIKGDSDMGLLSSFFEGYNIKNCHVKGEIISTGGWVGGLVGMCNADSIMNCSAEIKISSYDYCTGGLIGQCIDSEVIENCYATANITVTDGYSFGGFIGSVSTVNRSLTISNSYSKGLVSVETDSASERTGGFIGSMSGYSPDFINVINCFSTVDVIGNSRVGGFIGRPYQYANIENCYSTGNVTGNDNVGGFIGFIEYPETVTVANSYWDMETSGIDSSAAGEGRTTAEMTLPYYSNTYVDWDFGNVWADDIYNMNGGYPMLKWACGIEEDEDCFVAGDRGFELYQNYPNPFNPLTQIKFVLDKTSEVKLSVYNVKAQKISELASGVMNAGKHIIEFNGENLNSGVYYCIIKVDGKMQSKRMLLVK